MFDHRHYVPILKGKDGEYRALRETPPDVREQLTPLIEIPQVPWAWGSNAPRTTATEYAQNRAKKLIRGWGKEDRIFVDVFRLEEDGRSTLHPLTIVFNECRAADVQVIPVTGLDRDQRYQDAVEQAIQQDGRGACLRLTSPDFDDAASLRQGVDAFLSRFSLSAPEVDLVVDLGPIDQLSLLLLAARTFLSLLPYTPRWRSLTLAASSFPLNLGGFQGSSTDPVITPVPRLEWATWLAIAPRRRPRRIPAFGDYGIQHPEPEELDPRIIRMSASLRYTTTDSWLIAKGRNVRDFGFKQFGTICRKLRRRAEYSGAGFSWGDNYISECGQGRETSGNATTWRQIGTNHHLAFVVNQIAKSAP